MKRNRRAKIVATVGPASGSPEMLEALFLAGVDTFRLNFSHGVHADHAKVHASIRALENKVGRPIGILQDLQGPKIRVGTIRDGKISVAAGESEGAGGVAGAGSAGRALSAGGAGGAGGGGGGAAGGGGGTIGGGGAAGWAVGPGGWLSTIRGCDAQAESQRGTRTAMDVLRANPVFIGCSSLS